MSTDEPRTIHAKRGYPWEGHPWVWVVDFRRLTDDQT